MKAAARKIYNEKNGSKTQAPLIVFPRKEEVEWDNAELVAEYQRQGNRDILEEILDRNQGLLHAVLRKFSYFPDPYEDLLQVANLGLIKAVKRFDIDRGIEFSSYATRIVDGEVRHYLRDNVLMRQPRWLRNAERDIEQASIDLMHRLKRRPTMKELAKKVNISEEGVVEILQASAAASIHSVDDAYNREKGLFPINAETIHSLRYESFILPIEDRIVLQQAFDSLSVFHKRLVYLLFYKDLTQTEVAQEMGLNQRKISRESAKALNRLRAVLNTKIF